VRLNVYRAHRQTVQYVQPQHVPSLANAELLVIDEAAAIPLPMVKAMLGPYLVFLCSTVNGYEGTGRSLSLKLLQQLRAQGARLGGSKSKAAGKGSDAAAAAAAAANGAGSDGTGGGANGDLGGRAFREIVLAEPIRYAAGDAVEGWLNGLLCLDAAEHTPPPPGASLSLLCFVIGVSFFTVCVHSEPQSEPLKPPFRTPNLAPGPSIPNPNLAPRARPP
jgi:N-acetyltransferase 10